MKSGRKDSKQKEGHPWVWKEFTERTLETTKE